MKKTIKARARELQDWIDWEGGIEAAIRQGGGQADVPSQLLYLWEKLLGKYYEYDSIRQQFEEALAAMAAGKRLK